MKKTILIAAVMFFALTVAASAQALFQVGSTPVTTVASCGTTELAGDVVFTTAAGSLPVTTGTITINYGVPVTSTAGATFAVTANGVDVTDTGVVTLLSATGNQVVLAVNPGAGLTNPVVIRVSGVRVNVSGNPGLSNLTATVTATGNAYVGGQTNVVVISSIASALNATLTITGASLDAPQTLTNISSVSPVDTSFTANVAATEGFLNAWVAGSTIRFDFSALPAGFTFTFPTTVTYGTGSAGTFTLVNSDLSTATAPKSTFASTAAAPQGAFSVYYRLTTAPADAATTLETLTIPVGVAIAGTPRPLAQGSVTVSANMATLPAGSVPNYAGTSCATGTATVLTVVTANTNLLIPYATAGGGYDTGIAIANTTSDPFTGTNSAVKQNGTITFYFYPQTGDAFQFPAAGGTLAVGSGLTSGVLNTGRLYTVLLSELLAAAGQPEAFSGYVIAVVNATNAHGQYFISDFAAFTNGALMLVIDPAQRRTAPEKLDN